MLKGARTFTCTKRSVEDVGLGSNSILMLNIPTLGVFCL